MIHFPFIIGWILNAKRLSLVTKEAVNRDDCTAVLQVFLGKVFCFVPMRGSNDWIVCCRTGKVRSTTSMWRYSIIHQSTR